uniref:Uncharacterized protein n=1 Tax=Anopheles darlingi TaxID=43151 RepID=A0A2M4DG01_ANODA
MASHYLTFHVHFRHLFFLLLLLAFGTRLLSVFFFQFPLHCHVPQTRRNFINPLVRFYQTKLCCKRKDTQQTWMLTVPAGTRLGSS